MKVLLSLIIILTAQSCFGQYAFYRSTPPSIDQILQPRYPEKSTAAIVSKKLFQRNTGVILGLQKGSNTAIELGGEAHWRKISLKDPRILGATANMEYNFSSHVIGYKAGIWQKKGRINFTYGGNVSYYSNFKGGNRWGFGPSIGFRLLGLHLVNGFTFLTRDNGNPEDRVEVNNLYLSIRYYIPVENKFTWDRKTMKKKRERRKERDKQKKEREEKERRKEEGGRKRGKERYKRMVRFG